jgi:hypothetical protein
LLYDRDAPSEKPVQFEFCGVYLRFIDEPDEQQYAELESRLKRLDFPNVHSKSFSITIVPLWLFVVYNTEHGSALVQAITECAGDNARCVMVTRNNAQTSILAFFQGTCTKANRLFPAIQGAWLPEFYDWAAKLYDKMCTAPRNERIVHQLTIDQVINRIHAYEPNLHPDFVQLWTGICFNTIANLGLFVVGQRPFEPRFRNTMSNISYHDRGVKKIVSPRE